MLLYRIIPYVAAALPGAPGHPLCLNHTQGLGRLDNPAHHAVAYFAMEPSEAVGERFGDDPEWNDAMFRSAEVPGGVCALATYMLADQARLLAGQWHEPH